MEQRPSFLGARNHNTSVLNKENQQAASYNIIDHLLSQGLSHTKDRVLQERQLDN